MSEPIRVIEVDTEVNHNDLNLSTEVSNNDLHLEATPKMEYSPGVIDNIAESINDDDYVMISSNKMKKKTLFSTIKSALSSVFASISHTHTKSQITDFPSLGTAASKNVGDFAVSEPLSPSIVDLDTIKTPGFYNMGGSGDITINHKPTQDEGYGIVVIRTAGGNFYTQLAFKHIDGKCYKRYFKNDTWTEWVEQDFAPISHTHNAKDITGGNLTVDNIYLPGYNNTIGRFSMGNERKHIDIGWQWDGNQGAGISLKSANYVGQEGNISIYARRLDENGKSQTAMLILSPDGVMNWCDRRVVTMNNPSTGLDRPIVNNGYGIVKPSYLINRLLSNGTGTVGYDAGSNASPRYFPTVITFDAGLDNLKDGDEIVIKLPCGGHTYGVWLSVDNGNSYAPIITPTASKLTTNFAADTDIHIIYRKSMSIPSTYPVNGANSSTTYTGDAWQVINYKDADTYTATVITSSSSVKTKYATYNNYKITNKSYIYVTLINGNTAASNITLNINSQGAKPIYINGEPSSSTNYELPAGSYLVYYDDGKYFFRTDGKITTAGFVDTNNNPL